MSIEIILSRQFASAQELFRSPEGEIFPLVLTAKMAAWALGDRKRVEQILRKHVRALGKKRAYGRGRVNSINVEWCEDDHSLVRDSLAMRWLPDAEGLRSVRPRPPYWNIVGAVPCCEIGDGALLLA